MCSFLERIMQTGKKKLVLDHLIVQKMDDDDGKEDVQNILMFGAQALFEGEGGESKDIQCKSWPRIRPFMINYLGDRFEERYRDPH